MGSHASGSSSRSVTPAVGAAESAGEGFVRTVPRLESDLEDPEVTFDEAKRRPFQQDPTAEATGTLQPP
jgi:hypothetical protein